MQHNAVPQEMPIKRRVRFASKLSHYNIVGTCIWYTVLYLESSRRTVIYTNIPQLASNAGFLSYKEN